LLKITNAKAGLVADTDSTEPGRPTLKRRQPEGTDGDSNDSTGSSSSSSSSDGPPQLKRRDVEPAPAASPTPKP
jgi:hypothetical protein